MNPNPMKLQVDNEKVVVTGITELVAANSFAFRDQVRATMTEAQRDIEIDLSTIHFMDSSGLGALIGLHKTTRGRKGSVRLLNPTPQVEQILRLTRTNRLFEVVKAAAA
jgi:anti-sigma B factor antagonist